MNDTLWDTIFIIRFATIVLTPICCYTLWIFALKRKIHWKPFLIIHTTILIAMILILIFIELGGKGKGIITHPLF